MPTHDPPSLFTTNLTMRTLLSIGLLVALGAPTYGQNVLIVNAEGKETKAKNAKFIVGARHLSWLADPKTPVPPAVKGKPPAVGPEYLEIREGLLFQVKEGVTTLTPIASLKSLDFDKVKKTVTAKVLLEGGGEVSLIGSTEYLKINKFQLEADVDLGQLGAARKTFKGGEAKEGVQSIRFPDAVPLAKRDLGTKTKLVTREKDEVTHDIGSLEPLYTLQGGMIRTWPFLYFQKTVKAELAKIKGMRAVSAEDLKQGTVMEVTLGGKTAPLVVNETPTLAEDLAPPRLIGLVGKTAVGYQIVPLARIHEFVNP